MLVSMGACSSAADQTSIAAAGLMGVSGGVVLAFTGLRTSFHLYSVFRVRVGCSPVLDALGICVGGYWEVGKAARGCRGLAGGTENVAYCCTETETACACAAAETASTFSQAC